MENQNKNQEDELTSWLWAGLWLLFVYVSIPLARAIQRFVRDELTSDLFSWITIGFLLFAIVMIIRKVRSGLVVLRPAQSAVLMLLSGLFCWFVWVLRANPEEAFHFVQYGVLSVLLYRALYHRFRDASLYLVAFGLGAIAGTFDELIQWIVPERFFDFRDIGINMLAGLFVQSAIGLGIRPSGIRPRFEKAGLRLFLWQGVFASVLFIMITGNTPEMWDRYKDKIPIADEMTEVLVEYGYRIEDPRIGIFYSRLTPDELRKQDAGKGVEIAKILDQYRTGNAYNLLMERTPVYEQPFLIEARTHIRSRDDLYNESKSPEDSRVDVDLMRTRSFFENLILEQYFGEALRHSRYKWSDDKRAWIESQIDKDHVFESKVSRNLITRFSQKQAMAIPSLFLVLFLCGLWMLPRRVHS